MREIILDGSGKNALSTQLMSSMLAAFQDAKDEPVLLSGRGDAFSAGLHLKEIASLDDAGLGRYLEILDELILAIYVHPAPVIAHVNGHAIAGGCIVAMCADVRVATDDPKVRIGLNEVAIGLEFPPRIMKLVRARVGRSSVDRILLEAGLYTPADALRLGLVDEISSDSAAAARAIADKLASYSRATYQATKHTLRHGVLDLSKEELGAFREKTLPLWCAQKQLLAETLNR